MLERYDSILIGGSGFVGTRLAAHLVGTGERVLNVSRRQPEESLSGVDFSKIDFQDEKVVTSFALPRTASLIILIGQIGPDFDPESDRMALQRIIALANTQTDPISILYCSTALVYGNCDKPAQESDLLQPIEPYAKHKAENEVLLENSLARHHRLGILRLSNVFGDTRSRGFVSLIMNRFLTPRTDVFRINGDGDQERDYIYVDDLAEAIVSIKAGLRGRDTVNVAAGESRTLLSVLNTVQSVCGKRLAFEITHTPIVEAVKFQVSNKHLQERYGYSPRHTFDEGIRLMWRRTLMARDTHIFS